MRAWLAVTVSDKLQDTEMYHFINHSCLSVDGMNHQQESRSPKPEWIHTPSSRHKQIHDSSQ